MREEKEMKRRIAAICLFAALLASLLAGCGGQQKTTQSANEPAATQQTPARPSAEPTAQPSAEPTAQPSATPDPEAEKGYQEAMRAYEAVLEQSADIVYNGWSAEKEYPLVPSGVMEVSSMPRAELLQYLGYTFEDLSGDGLPELLIGVIPDENAEIPQQQYILGGYSCKDGEPVCFLEGWARNFYGWLGDGRFYNFGSGGFAYSGFGTFRISEDGTELQCENWYFSDLKNENDTDVTYYHNTTGVWEKAAAEETDMDSDAFWALSDQYAAECKTLALTPFADYEYTGTINQPLECKVRVDYLDDAAYRYSYYDDAAEYMPAGEYETTILFQSEEGVKDFKLLALTLNGVDANGAASFDIETVFNIPSLRAGIPVAVPMSFPGDIPSNGFSYTDADGSTKTYAVGMSGLDGSLVVSPLD
jgi:hypothetical protein